MEQWQVVRGDLNLGMTLHVKILYLLSALFTRERSHRHLGDLCADSTSMSPIKYFEIASAVEIAFLKVWFLLKGTGFLQSKKAYESMEQ